MASKDIKEKEEKKKLKKETKEKQRQAKKEKKEKTKKEKVKKTKHVKKHDTVVFVDNEEDAKRVLNEVMEAPMHHDIKEEKKKNFWSEVGSLFVILLIIGGVVGAGFLIHKFVKPFESKKSNTNEETKVVESNDYKTVVYKAAEDRYLDVIDDTYLIEYKDNVLYKLLDMDGNVLFEGNETYSDIIMGIDEELYLVLYGADLENDYASASVYKFVDKKLVEVFTAADAGYLYTNLVYRVDGIEYLVGIVGETLLNDDDVKVETVLYTLDNDRREIKDVRLHGEDNFRLAIDEPIVTYSKDYVVVKDSNDENKFGVYDIKNNTIVLNTKYDGLYTTMNGNYIAVKGKKAGLVNVKSKMLIDFKYDFIYDAGNFYVVSKDKKLGIIDNEYNVVIKPTFAFQHVGNAGFSYRLCCGAINSFSAIKYKDKYVLTVNEGELEYQINYKVHETYVIDSKGEYLTIGSNEFGINGDFIYSYDKVTKKYAIYDENYAEKYTIDISDYDFEDGPYISLLNDNTIRVELDTALYYDFATGEEIDGLKDATFVVDKIEFKYIAKDKKVTFKVNGEVISTYDYVPDGYNNFYKSIDDNMYYFVANNTYAMVRKSE